MMSALFALLHFKINSEMGGTVIFLRKQTEFDTSWL